MSSESCTDSQSPGCNGFASQCHGIETDRPRNIFALVAYIPDPLGKFLDDLRLELVPGCRPHAHVTILPPRPISVEAAAGADAARTLTAGFPAFEIEIAEVGIFPKTDVIYLEVGMGSGQLHRMHAAMNRDGLAFAEPFEYHPHVTLAQDLPPGRAPELAEVARRRWAEFRHSRTFFAETLAFVQNTENNCWIDLAECHLAVPVPVVR